MPNTTELRISATDWPIPAAETDIPGLSLTFTAPEAVTALAILSAETRLITAPVFGASIAIRINGDARDEDVRFIEVGAAFEQTQTAHRVADLPAGTHTITGRAQRDSGGSRIDGNRAHLFIIIWRAGSGSPADLSSSL